MVIRFCYGKNESLENTDEKAEFFVGFNLLLSTKRARMLKTTVLVSYPMRDILLNVSGRTEPF